MGLRAEAKSTVYLKPDSNRFRPECAVSYDTEESRNDEVQRFVSNEESQLISMSCIHHVG